MAAPEPRDPGERRRRVLLSFSLVLLLFATAAASSLSAGAPVRGVDVVRVSGLIMLALVIGLRATTSFTLLKRNPELDDELSRANRSRAARAGFWAMLLGAAAVLMASLFLPVTVAEAAPMLLALGAAGAGLRFATLESRGR